MNKFVTPDFLTVTPAKEPGFFYPSLINLQWKCSNGLFFLLF